MSANVTSANLMSGNVKNSVKKIFFSTVGKVNSNLVPKKVEWFKKSIFENPVSSVYRRRRWERKGQYNFSYNLSYELFVA